MKLRGIKTGGCFVFIMLTAASGVEALAQKRAVHIPRTSRQVIHGVVTDDRGKPLIAQVQVWYDPLTPVVFVFGDSKSGERTDNLISISYTSDKGYYAVKVPADTVTVIVTKGPEWSFVKGRFVIGQEEFDGIEFDVTLRRLYDLSALGWYGGDPHHHTVFSDGYQTPSQAAHAMKGVGLSWGILTDHNSATGANEWLANQDQDLVLVAGGEVTTEPSEESPENGYGHMNQSFVRTVNLKDPGDPNIWARACMNGHQDVQQLIDLTHKQGGFIAINHPFQSWDWSGRFKSWGKVRHFDAIEVWNGEPPHSMTINEWDTNHVNINTWAVHAWFSYLNAGNRISGIAGSDAHDVYGINAYPKGPFLWTTTTGNPRTYAYARTLDEKNIRQSLRNGNLFLTSTFGPIVLVSVNGKIPGEIVQVAKGGTVTVDVEVLANQSLLRANGALRIIYNGTAVVNLPTDSALVFKQSLSFTPGADGWLVCEVFGPWPMYAVSNPVYIDHAPYGDLFVKGWSDPADAVRWNVFLSHPEITLPDGPRSDQNTQDALINLQH